MIIFFFVVFGSILYSAHFALYVYLSHFFVLQGVIKSVFFVLTFVLPLLFLVALITTHYSSSLPARVFYYLTGLWHGVLVNLLLAIFSSLIVLVIAKIFFAEVTAILLLRIGITAMVFALLLSIYGIYNVFDIKTRVVDISLNNLPEEWQGRRAAFITDVHLGAILRKGHMERIKKEIRAAEVDIIFITGDLFDSINGSAKLFSEILQDLDAPLGVYYVSGNHETYFGIAKSEEILSATNITVLKDELIEIDGVQIVGLAYPARRDAKERIESIVGFDSTKTNILLCHEPVAIPQFKEAGVNLMLAGHTHKGQMWPFNFITSVIFKGYDYGFFKEGDFHLYVSSGSGVWGPTMRTSGKTEVVVFNFKS